MMVQGINLAQRPDCRGGGVCNDQMSVALIIDCPLGCAGAGQSRQQCRVARFATTNDFQTYRLLALQRAARSLTDYAHATRRPHTNRIASCLIGGLKSFGLLRGSDRWQDCALEQGSLCLTVRLLPNIQRIFAVPAITQVRLWLMVAWCWVLPAKCGTRLPQILRNAKSLHLETAA